MRECMQTMKKACVMITVFLFPRLLAAQALDFSALEGEQWFGLYMNGQKSGYAVNNVEVQSDGSVVVSEDARFRMTMLGIRQDMRILSTRTYSADGDLRSIVSKIDDPSGQKEFNAVVEGDELKLVSQITGTVKEETFPKPAESLRDALKQLELVMEDPAVGREVAFSLFDPLFKREITGVSRIEGEEERVFQGVKTRVFRVLTSIREMNLETVSYVTEDGKTLEDHIAGLITMRLEPKELATDVDYSNDVIVSNAALVDTPIENPRTRESLRLKLRGPLRAGHLFNDARQTLTPGDDGYTFVGQRIDLEGFEPAQLPIDEESVQQWLEPTTFVQSDQAPLIEKAREIVGDETNSLKAVEKLSDWVSDNVRSTFSAQLTNALEVLKNLEGDCTEHSILFIGLCRAAGIPAREVAGLVYVEGSQPGFYFHQWATVWVGRWIDVDPTFDQPLADVTHIKLSEGDLFEQSGLIPIIGQIQVDVLDEVPAG